MKANKKRKWWWHFIIGAATGLIVLTFTPLILDPGRIHPKFLSLPYTLWASILVTILLVILTYLGSRVREYD